VVVFGIAFVEQIRGLEHGVEVRLGAARHADLALWPGR